MAYACVDKERKLCTPSKCKISEDVCQTAKESKNLELKRSFSNCSALANSHSRKQPRKGDHPVRLPSVDCTQEHRAADTWICKNSACKAILTLEDTFCKRCSCCICHLFDDNKDPSLWLVCTSEFDDKDCCGLSCHIECALLCRRIGVFYLGQSMLLDGSYCCASCGKISGIIGSWRRQLAIARDARRVDVLCYRILLSHRLLDGTSRFKELHQIVEEAKAKLETEVGPVNGVSARMVRGIVSRLSVAGDVQKLCSDAIDKADEWLKSASHADEENKDSLPAACRFQFEEITSSSLVIVLKETSCLTSDAIMGYKLWYCSNREQSYKNEPVIFPRAQRRILISNLQPCTEYSFRIISFTKDGDLGHSESKCFTKSVEIINKNIENDDAEKFSSDAKRKEKMPATKSLGFKVRNLGKILQLAWAQEEGCYEGLYQDEVEQDSDYGTVVASTDPVEEYQAAPLACRCQLDLNEASVPDLNAEVIPPAECSPDEENGCCYDKSELVRSDGSGDSQTCAAMLFGESLPACRKEPPSTMEETCDEFSTLITDGHQFSHRFGQLDDSYEYCVKVVRWLECSGYIESDFRLKFLTWFSLRSSEQERRVVITYIRTLIEEPSSLAGQLLDSFSEIVTCKGLQNGFCSKLWH